jgi:hypothetical protein
MYCYSNVGKVLQLLNGFRVQGFLVLVTRYLQIDLRPFLASHESTAPFKPPSRRGNNPLWYPLNVSFR